MVRCLQRLLSVAADMVRAACAAAGRPTEVRNMVTRRALLVCAALGPILARANAAEAWPQRPVKIIVPFAAGGNTDGIARVIGQNLSESFATQFVIENKPGADGAIAAEAV